MGIFAKIIGIFKGGVKAEAGRAYEPYKCPSCGGALEPLPRLLGEIGQDYRCEECGKKIREKPVKKMGVVPTPVYQKRLPEEPTAIEETTWGKAIKRWPEVGIPRNPEEEKEIQARIQLRIEGVRKTHPELAGYADWRLKRAEEIREEKPYRARAGGILGQLALGTAALTSRALKIKSRAIPLAVCWITGIILALAFGLVLAGFGFILLGIYLIMPTPGELWTEAEAKREADLEMARDKAKKGEGEEKWEEMSSKEKESATKGAWESERSEQEEARKDKWEKRKQKFKGLFKRKKKKEKEE